MASKRKSTKKRDSNTISVGVTPDEEKATTMARILLRPTVNAAFIIKSYGDYWRNLDIKDLVDSLSEQAETVSDGNFERGEAMLTAQAHSLDAIFGKLARTAILNIGENVGVCDTYLKLALRAQSQCRSTWEAVSAMTKVPAKVF